MCVQPGGWSSTLGYQVPSGGQQGAMDCGPGVGDVLRWTPRKRDEIQSERLG